MARTWTGVAANRTVIVAEHLPRPRTAENRGDYPCACTTSAARFTIRPAGNGSSYHELLGACRVKRASRFMTVMSPTTRHAAVADKDARRRIRSAQRFPAKTRHDVLGGDYYGRVRSYPEQPEVLEALLTSRTKQEAADTLGTHRATLKPPVERDP